MSAMRAHYASMCSLPTNAMAQLRRQASQAMHRFLQVPNRLQTVADLVASELAVGEIHAPMGECRLRSGGELFSFPSRVYYRTGRIAAVTHGLQGEARELALCLASRHHDGHVREASIRNPYFFGSALVIPFSVQLLGEYVVEIGKVIEEQIAVVGLQPFVDFAKENPAFVETTRRRAISYWDCYYRRDYVNLRDFPCYRAIQSIILAARE